jgi:hypothetical protein
VAVEMRVTRCAFALAIGLAACGEGEDHENRERPAATINVTAAIIDGRINVSPTRIGAGPIRLIVTNQTDSAQAITFETAGESPGITQKSAPIKPLATATLAADAPEGDYTIATSDGEIRPATVKVGAPRPSAQNELLLP